MGKKNRAKARNRAPLTFDEAWRRWRAAPQNLFGTEAVGDDPAVTYEQRRGRCYELSAAALVIGAAPSNARLIHGTWRGPGVTHPVGHGWLLLPDGTIWEPIRARIHHPEVWGLVARPVAEVSYSYGEAAQMVGKHLNWGCWHDTDGLTYSDEHGLRGPGAELVDPSRLPTQ